MSKLIVEVCLIDSVSAHSNADSLDLCTIKGWQCVIAKGSRKAGDKVVYIPPDSMIPITLADKIGITKYLGGVTPDKTSGRVRCAKLRGEPSFGVIIDCDDPDWEIGRDVAEHYGITKYVPEIKLTAGDAEPMHPLLQKYTEIENLRNYPGIFTDGEMVVATEKLHGTNCKTGMIEGEWMAGSMEVRRKWPASEVEMQGNVYWFPYTIDGVRRFVEFASKQYRQVLVFGEVYGKIQSLNYGKPGAIGFAAFDIMIDGKYMDFAEFQYTCGYWNIPVVPVLEMGEFSLEMVKRNAMGQTTMPGASHIREGTVIRPTIERHHPRVGRVIMKYINDDYLMDKEKGKVTDHAAA